MMSMLAFLLPAEELPPLEELACMVETDHTHEAYVPCSLPFSSDERHADACARTGTSLAAPPTSPRGTSGPPTCDKKYSK